MLNTITFISIVDITVGQIINRTDGKFRVLAAKVIDAHPAGRPFGVRRWEAVVEVVA